MIRYVVTMLFGALLLSPSGVAAAQEYGIVTDLAGKISITRGQENVPAEIGESVRVGDRIDAAPQSLMVLVSISDCREWLLEGENSFTISGDAGPQPERGTLSAYRTMPACYDPELFKDAASPEIGGVIIRGLVDDLRKEVREGNPANSTLITLIMHDLNKGDVSQAKQYFEQLRKRAPGSTIVKKLAPTFK